MSYPRLEVYRSRVYDNALILRRLCEQSGVSLCSVIKGFDGQPDIIRAQAQAGISTWASVSLHHLQLVRELDLPTPPRTLALRIPMPSELDELVRAADISLNSEPMTLKLLDQAAAAHGCRHSVILMRDLGDLREGVFAAEDFHHLAVFVERELPHLHLLGVGANLSCYGSVIPTADNLGELVRNAREIEASIGRSLEVVSGGATSSLPLLARGQLPAGVNMLRVGEGLVVPCDLLDYWQCPIPGLRNDTLILRGEVIEANVKPTYPQGELGRDALGMVRQYQDRGCRRRILAAMGVAVFGDGSKLIPLDPGLRVLGESSDHLILDAEESQRDYRPGDIVSFELHYKAMLFAMASPQVEKVVCD